jgi:hypothetical protein
VVDKVVLGQIYIRVLQVSPIDTIPPWFHTNVSFKAGVLNLVLTSTMLFDIFLNGGSSNRHFMLVLPSKKVK